MDDIALLKKEIKACTICAENLALGPKPVVSFSTSSRMAIIGQAPGTKVHASGIPWDDKSGDNLRKWMNIEKKTFYDDSQIAIVPMGFCYPGKGKSGDLPPRKECAPQWHDQIFKLIPNLELVLLVGSYAQSYYLKDEMKKTLTATVKNFHEYLPKYFVLPHPSPRNNIWMKRNEWFASDVLPVLKRSVSDLLDI